MRTLDRKSEKNKQPMTDPLITQAKFYELQNKLEHLKKVSQPKAAEEVRRLAEMGDFSENFAYQAAKGRLRGINANILKLENQLNRVVIIFPKNSSTIEIGHTVTVEVKGKQKTFQILGSTETDPVQGIISHSSPIGKALLGHSVGDIVIVRVLGKEIPYTIISIQ